MKFKKEIEIKLQEIDIQESRINAWENWSEYLFSSKIKKINELTAYQVGFLEVLSQKFDEIIIPLINTKVREELDNWYEKPNAYNEISINAIDIRDIENEEWQIMFEDDNIDPVVHLYMKGWEFDYTALTG